MAGTSSRRRGTLAEAMAQVPRARSRSPARRIASMDLPATFIMNLELAVAKAMVKGEMLVDVEGEGDGRRQTASSADIRLNVRYTIVRYPIIGCQKCFEVVINGKLVTEYVGYYDELVQGLSGVFDVIAIMVTRWKLYELVAAPVQGREDQTNIAALFTRLPTAVKVKPAACAPWSLQARISELEPEANELQDLRAKIQRMQAMYGVPNCFLANTVFRQQDGRFKAVQDLAVDETVRLANGQNARITHAIRLTPAMHNLVELVTNQASLRVAANHRITTTGGPCAARTLKLGDSVVVGNRVRQLTNVRAFQEGVELFDVRFSPDGPLEAYVIPDYGIQVLGAAPPLAEVFQNTPLDELMQAMPARYED